MSESLSPSITILLLHHTDDELTRHHGKLLQEANAADPGVSIVPICFAQYADTALPGSWIVADPQAFRTNRLSAFHRFQHVGGPLIPDLDCLIWDYVLHGGTPTDRIVLAEGDMLSRCSIREFFGPSFRHETSGSVVRRGVDQNRDWWWYPQTPADQREVIGDRVGSITPVCGIQMSWALAERMARLVQESPGRYDNIHVEMALGTLARIAGAEPAETVVADGRRAAEFIDFSPAGLTLADWGIFHPVKQILKEGHGLPFRDRAHLTGWSIGADDYEWLVGWCRENGARHVVEFGPGDSTLAFLEAGCTILSAEHDGNWQRLAADRFSRDEAVEVVPYEDAPGCGWPPPDAKPDLVFVDGPPSAGPNGRWHTLRWGLQHADNVVIHDARRKEEREILGCVPADEWAVTIIPTGKGLALLQRKPDAPVRQLPPPKRAHERYRGLKQWGWYLDDLAAWRALLETGECNRSDLLYTGYEPGEAIEIQSVDHPADYFQVAIPGRAPVWTLSERQITAVEMAPGRYRASQKIVIYSSGNNDQQYLSDQQWHTLKNLGYVAIHNGEFVYKSPADTMKLLKELGITDIHPPEGALPVLHKYLQENGDLTDTKGLPVPTEKLPTLARFKVDEFCPHGYQDHHLFNKFHKSVEKQKKWESMLKAVMGGDFEIDEFTVPVNTAWHGRTQGPVTAMWEGVYSDLEAKCEFDSAGNAKLKKGVSGAVLRKGIWKKMEDGAEMMQVSLGRMRPWPTVLEKPSHPLFKKLRAGGWQQGASLEKWQQMSGRSLSQVATQVELQNARKSLTKSLLGTVGRKGKVLAGGLLKRSTSVLTILGLLGTAVNLTGAEWREHLSVKLHEEMKDAEIAGIKISLDQCREVVRLHLTENEIIAAGIPHERFILPSGQEIFSGQTIFYEIRFNPDTSIIHTVVWCQIVEIKSFLDGGYKVALRMEDGSSRTFDQSRFRFIVSDYSPQCGGSAADWAKAYKKAEVLEFIQNY